MTGVCYASGIPSPHGLRMTGQRATPAGVPVRHRGPCALSAPAPPEGPGLEMIQSFYFVLAVSIGGAGVRAITLSTP